MSQRDREFWTSDHRYEDLAKRFERNIEILFPEDFRNCRCRWEHCTYAASTVTYYEYRGDAI
jgi:hypothetical protein